MMGRLLTAGYEVAVTTRTRSKAEPVLEQGARWCDSPREVAQQCDLFCTMLGYPSDVEAVYLGPDGILTAAEPVSLTAVVDFTTSSPELAARIAECAQEQGTAAFDAPVSGGDIGARNGTLSIMLGGASELPAEAQEAFLNLGQKMVLQGPPGSGQHTKMVNQIIIATNMVGMCEGLLYAQRAGLDPEQVLESVGGGAAGSWSLDQLAPRILRGDFAPGFFVEHFIKDLGIALVEAERLRLSLPGLALAKQLYEAVRAQGHEKSGTQALFLALEKLSSA